MATTNDLLSKRNRKNQKRMIHSGGPNRMHRAEKMNAVFSEMPQADILEKILQSDMANLQKTLDESNRAVFELAVEMILAARRIYIVGVRSCEPLASFLGFYLNLMFDDVRVISSNSASEIFEQIFRIDERDVLIGISFPRYSMRTLKAMEMANDRSAKVIALTDSVHSPMKLYSTCTLTARSEMSSVVDSLTAPLSMLNALVVALCMKRQKEMSSSLETLEKVWEEYQVYNNDEINYIDNHIEVKFPALEKEQGTKENCGKGDKDE